ncbi:hypothetical protein G6F43_010193 [Rhizopus delemar]|nr:hypothetical protein G6F43_010193 [Rhizopus delemar]
MQVKFFTALFLLSVFSIQVFASSHKDSDSCNSKQSLFESEAIYPFDTGHYVQAYHPTLEHLSRRSDGCFDDGCFDRFGCFDDFRTFPSTPPTPPTPPN